MELKDIAKGSKIQITLKKKESVYYIPPFRWFIFLLHFRRRRTKIY